MFDFVWYELLFDIQLSVFYVMYVYKLFAVWLKLIYHVLSRHQH